MPSTTGELVKAKAIALEDVQHAVDAFLAQPDRGDFDLGGGYVLDLTATIASSLYAKLVLQDANSTEVKRRTAIRTAILLAIPTSKA